jgi:hypothetical protein
MQASSLTTGVQGNRLRQGNGSRQKTTMQPIIIPLHKSKALGILVIACLIGSTRLGGMWHLLNVISEILGAFVVVLLHGPSSICMSLSPTVLIRSSLSLTQLPQCSDKRKSNQTTRPRKTMKREATRHRKNNYTERTQKGERLSPLGACPIPGPTKQEWLIAEHKLKP